MTTSEKCEGKQNTYIRSKDNRGIDWRFIRALIGHRQAEMLVANMENHQTQAQLATRFGMSRPAITQHIAKARRKLISAGLWPRHWPKSGRAKAGSLRGSDWNVK